jgi:two-component system response regulator TctD
MRLLLLEDTEDVADAIVASFGRRGDAVDHVTSVDEAKSAIGVQSYDVMILDIGLPDGLGTDVLRFARDKGVVTPILMLTARSDIDDRVSALDRGADDYLVKPFDLRELHARVRAMQRRQDQDRSGIIAFGDIVFDPAGLTVEVAGQAVVLARREFNLLEILLANRERVVPKEKIFDRMFSFNDESVNVNAVELYVGRLRKKLGTSRVSIKTLRGLGYQLVDEA